MVDFTGVWLSKSKIKHQQPTIAPGLAVSGKSGNLATWQ